MTLLATVTLSVLFTLAALSNTEAGGVTKCDMKVTKVGCYNDKWPSTFSELIINDRITRKFDFTKPVESMEDLICRCAKKIAEKKYTHFSIRSFGNCYSGEQSGDNYEHDGSSDRCVESGKDTCDDNSGAPCTGIRYSNYVYTIYEKPTCVDEWGSCERYASQGLCSEKDVKDSCPKACKLC